MIKHFFLLTALSLLSLGTASQQGNTQTRNLKTSQAAVDWRYGSFPVENFQGYTSPFGYRPSATGGGGTEFHSGLDFAAPEGSYIRNWWAGRVASVSDNTACGTMVQVQSGSWTHIYCHLSGQVEVDPQGNRAIVDRSGGLLIREGQAVSAGARIGRVGMTGRTTGPHLHWTLKYDGQLINPALVLQAMQSAQRYRPLLSARPTGKLKFSRD